MTDIPPFTITHRPLTREEAVQFHLALRTTPNILGYTVRELVRLTDVQVAEVDGRFAGAALSLELPFGWTEIAAILVLGEFRGMGIGKGLFEAAWQRAQERHRHIYMLSRNPQVIAWMRAAGMIVNGNIWSAPLAVQLWMPLYMASWYRNVEAMRKNNAIRKGHSLMQGVRKN